MKWLAIIGGVLFILIMYKFGWQIADWINNASANLGIEIGSRL